MRSLLELQREFARALTQPQAHSPGLAVYRNTLAANYRNALAATFPVAKRLAGDLAFDAAVDAFVAARPPASGDLNVYGDEFGDFLSGFQALKGIASLPDLARLEWAIDDANRAADAHANPGDVIRALAAIAPDDVEACRFALHPSCRFVLAGFPVYAMWSAHQQGGDPALATGGQGEERLLVRREEERVSVERLRPGDFAWLRALGEGRTLAQALSEAQRADEAFDIAAALARRVSDGTFIGVSSPAA